MIGVRFLPGLKRAHSDAPMEVRGIEDSAGSGRPSRFVRTFPLRSFLVSFLGAFASVRVAAVVALAVLPAVLAAQPGGSLVFSAAWGEGPGSVGLVDREEMERLGPLSFCVEGETAFVLDTVNRRLLRAREGKMAVLASDIAASALASDGAGGVWLRDGDRVFRIDDRGNRAADPARRIAVASDPRTNAIEGYGVELLRDPSGGVTFRSPGRATLEVAAPKVGARETANASGNKPRPSASALSYSVKRMEGGQVRLLGQDDEGKVLSSIPLNLDGGGFGAVLFKGRDTKGNVYVEVERLENGRAELEVHRYAPNGARLRVLPMENSYYTTVYKKTEVTPEGAVFQMLTTPDGVRIVRHDEGVTR